LMHPVPDRADPAAFLTDLNKRLAGLLPVGQYATMLYGVVDRAEGVFRYAAAAAPQPLAIAIDGLEVQIGDGSGLPLGVSKGASYKERRLAMPPGTVLFMASDALAEAQGEDGEMVGQSGVLDMLRRAVNGHRAEVEVDSILSPFLATAQRPLKDDLTAVCCRV
jgi:phosphoserine phosphatase RsbU/P